MKLLRWCFPLVILAFCGFLLLTSAFSPHPAVMRASMLRSYSLAAEPGIAPADRVDYQAESSTAHVGVRLLFPRLETGSYLELIALCSPL